MSAKLLKTLPREGFLCKQKSLFLGLLGRFFFLFFFPVVVDGMDDLFVEFFNGLGGILDRLVAHLFDPFFQGTDIGSLVQELAKSAHRPSDAGGGLKFSMGGILIFLPTAFFVLFPGSAWTGFVSSDF